MKMQNSSRVYLLNFFTILVLSSFLSSAAFAADASPSPKPKTKSPDIASINPLIAKQPKIEVVADNVEYDRKADKIVATGNVTLRDRDSDTTITCDYAEVKTDSKLVYAKGHVVIFRKGKAVSHGTEIHYDFENQTGSFPEGRIITIPWIITGESMKQASKKVDVVENGTITTCDLEKPHYELRAKTVKIIQGDKMIAKNIWIYVLDRPIFWWPFFVFPLHNQGNLPFSVSVGYNSRHGYYIETSAGFGITENIWGKWHLDYRSLRGPGGGMDINYNFNDKFGAQKLLGQGFVKGYVTQDKRAPSVIDDSNSYSGFDDRTRGRLTWVHRTDIDEHTNVILRYNRIADEFFLQDFFENESRSEIEPQSFVTFTKNSENFGFLGYVEKQANDFESLVQRLPQVQFDWKTQPFFNDHLFYENQTSYVNLNKERGRLNDDFNEHATRYDTFHEWTLPLKWNELKFTPFLDLRGTYYDRQRLDPSDVFRTILASGVDLRTQFYKTMDVNFNKAGIEINQLRHIFEPVVQYKTQTSSVSDEKLANFDSIDRLDDANVLTFGMENRLQTKRMVNGSLQRVDVVSLNTYLSYEMHPDGHPLGSQLYPPFEDGRTKSGFTIGSQEIVLRPYNWLQSETRFDYDLGRVNMRVFNQDIVLKKGRLKVVFGYRRVRDFQDFDGNEQYVFDTSYILNPLWTLGGYVRWYGGSMQEWQVIATRDLHDFILDLGYNVRNSDIQQNNKELFFNFRMKQFPELALRSGHRSSFSEARIGQTVAGSNQEAGISSQNTYQAYQQFN